MSANDVRKIFMSPPNVKLLYGIVRDTINTKTGFAIDEPLEDILIEHMNGVMNRRKSALARSRSIDVKQEIQALNKSTLAISVPFFLEAVYKLETENRRRRQQQGVTSQRQVADKGRIPRQVADGGRRMADPRAGQLSGGRKSEMTGRMEEGFEDRQRQLIQPLTIPPAKQIPNFSSDVDLDRFKGVDPEELMQQHQDTYPIEAGEEDTTFYEQPQVEFVPPPQSAQRFLSNSNPPPQPSSMHTIIPKTSRNTVSESKRIPHIYIVDSRDRNYDRYPAAHDYRVDVVPEYREVTSVELISAEIPKTSYLVNESNNLMYFEEDAGVRLIASIPSGNYSIGTLLAAIDTEMAAVSTNGVTYTSTLNALTDKITITSDFTLFNMLFYGGTQKASNDTERSKYLANSIGPVLGYERIDLNGALAYEASNIYDLSGDNYLLMFIFDLENIERPEAPVDQAFAKITLDVAQGAVKYYNDEENNKNIKHFSPTMGKMNDLVIKFKNYNGDFYDFNGREHSMTFKIITRDVSQKQY